MNDVELTLVQIATYYNRVIEHCSSHYCDCCKYKGYCSEFATISVKINKKAYKFLRTLCGDVNV